MTKLQTHLRLDAALENYQTCQATVLMFDVFAFFVLGSLRCAELHFRLRNMLHMGVNTHAQPEASSSSGRRSQDGHSYHRS